jgi:uncharacterized protein YoxC
VIASVDLGVPTVATFVGVALIVAVLASYLTYISVILRHVSFTLGTVLVGVRAIAHQTQPLGPVVKGIVSDIQGIQDDLAALLPDSQPARRGLHAGRRPAQVRP